jgi:acyl-coenzyme A thioesterase PaaI-like protein
MAAVSDEAMGAVAWMHGYPVVAARITVEFKKMMPLGTVARLEAKITRVDGRKVQVSGSLRDEQGVPYVVSSGLFIALPTSVFKSKKKR